MANSLIKRLVSKDKDLRINIYRMEYAENPRIMTDEPLHCRDWDRAYSIMVDNECNNRSEGMYDVLKSIIKEYGNSKAIVDTLVWNGKHMDDGKSKCDDALVYDKSERCWNLISRMFHYNRETGSNEMGWYINNHYYCRKDGIDFYALVEDVCSESIEYFMEKCLTDKVKVAFYDFHYYGELSFSSDFNSNSDGIAWIEKDEFLKYSGLTEKDWKEKDFFELERWLVDALKAWGEGNVYGFVTENGIRSVINKKYLNVDRQEETYEKVEWEEADSCWCYYDLDYCIEDACGEAGVKKEDLTEEAA